MNEPRRDHGGQLQDICAPTAVGVACAHGVEGPFDRCCSLVAGCVAEPPHREPGHGSTIVQVAG